MNTRLKNVETLRESYNLRDGEKGITLIALIVTIIVLLILAMVSVNLILRENLINKAQIAADEYEKAAQNESEALDYFESEINKYIPTIGGGDDSLIPTVWKERGITSTNVKFDILYYDENVDYGGDYNGLSICLFSNGDMCINFGSDVTQAKDEDGNNILGNGGQLSENVYIFLNNPDTGVRAFSNGFTFPNGPDRLTVRFTSDNKIKVYFKEAAADGTIELDSNGNVEEIEDNYIGTLLPQE